MHLEWTKASVITTLLGTKHQGSASGISCTVKNKKGCQTKA